MHFSDKLNTNRCTIDPANTQKCKDNFMKYCKNQQTCIHEKFFCDGHKHCEDGSDDDQEFCQSCPR